jgi:hypothetical protein
MASSYRGKENINPFLDPPVYSHGYVPAKKSSEAIVYGSVLIFSLLLFLFVESLHDPGLVGELLRGHAKFEQFGNSRRKTASLE